MTLNNLSGDSFNGTLANSVHLTTTEHIVIAVIMLNLSFLGMVMNVGVILTYILNKELQNSVNMFIASLSVGDALMSFLAVLVAVNNFAEEWLYGDAGCTFYAFSMTFLGLAAINQMSAVAADRYVVVTRPHSVLVEKPAAVTTIVICWLAAGIWAVMPLVGWSSYQPEADGTHCSIHWETEDENARSYIISLFVLEFFLPIVIICFCYGNIFHKFKFIGTKVHNEKSTAYRRRKRVERRLAKVICLMIGCFLASWTPYAVFSMWAAFGDVTSIPSLARVVPALLAKLSCVWDPIIYVGGNAHFRTHFVKYLPRMLTRKCIEEGEDQRRSDKSRSSLPVEERKQCELKEIIKENGTQDLSGEDE
ncbi:melanopsin-like [Lingula anatina]|uniref:Melanopsin-like n=1 Tax=Lingula anatina TaxID=7574 RepID=A0A1S3IIG6_LINAN|nr:melanopsin-like [Lingula anatina]|eukprot:XP_013397676.1 melanopsin-like [Lingula anatina]